MQMYEELYNPFELPAPWGVNTGQKYNFKQSTVSLKIPVWPADIAMFIKSYFDPGRVGIPRDGGMIRFRGTAKVAPLRPN